MWGPKSLHRVLVWLSQLAHQGNRVLSWSDICATSLLVWNSLSNRDTCFKKKSLPKVDFMNHFPREKVTKCESQYIASTWAAQAPHGECLVNDSFTVAHFFNTWSDQSGSVSSDVDSRAGRPLLHEKWKALKAAGTCEEGRRTEKEQVGLNVEHSFISVWESGEGFPAPPPLLGPPPVGPRPPHHPLRSGALWGADSHCYCCYWPRSYCPASSMGLA